MLALQILAYLQSSQTPQTFCPQAHKLRVAWLDGWVQSSLHHRGLGLRAATQQKPQIVMLLEWSSMKLSAGTCHSTCTQTWQFFWRFWRVNNHFGKLALWTVCGRCWSYVGHLNQMPAQASRMFLAVWKRFPPLELPHEANWELVKGGYWTWKCFV